MNTQVTTRLNSLRKEMKAAGIDAYVIPSSDPHLSEYPPECWKDRAWISGFDGSAGTVVVTLEEAGLWTDSRYFLQAEKQLEGTTITLYKEGVPGTPTISEFLRQHANTIRTVGFKGKAISYKEAHTLQCNIAVLGIKTEASLDLVGNCREEAPTLPAEPLFIHPLKYAGKSTSDKVAEVRLAMEKIGANTIILNTLDEVAWLFNLRGADVLFNPVGLAYGLITPSRVILYADREKLSNEVITHLTENGVETAPYENIYHDVSELPSELVFCVDENRINYDLYQAIPLKATKISHLSPITLLKACKNEAEYQGYLAAMKRDGIALTRFFMWLESELANGNSYSEYEIGVHLANFRAKSDYYVSDSFATIAGYNGNGAIVHYSANEKNSAQVIAKGILLLDSGAQYKDGTTDITRTISLDGNPTTEQKQNYTRVLKGHIALATAIYPQGTRGSQLDILARKTLWDNCQNYGHGTGHGVGHFLNVHEGPQNIRMDENPTTLMPGMVTSNEPGIYIANEYGIRIENLIRTIPYKTTDFGNFYAFETLTLCYLDNTLVDVNLLTNDELSWYNAYQARVYNELSPLLEQAEAEWLKNKTQPLHK